MLFILVTLDSKGYPYPSIWTAWIHKERLIYRLDSWNFNGHHVYAH
jgi:hypothetical protein